MIVDNDGVCLNSVAHPEPSLWQRIRFWFRHNDLRYAELEEMEIEIPELE